MISSRVSASAVRERSVSTATDARRVTGASPAVDPVSATGTPTSATRGQEPASAAGTTREETSVTGDQAVSDQIKQELSQRCGGKRTKHF